MGKLRPKKGLAQGHPGNPRARLSSYWLPSAAYPQETLGAFGEVMKKEQGKIPPLPSPALNAERSRFTVTTARARREEHRGISSTT